MDDADRAIVWRRYILATTAYHAVNGAGDFVEGGVYQGRAVVRRRKSPRVRQGCVYVVQHIVELLIANASLRNRTVGVCRAQRERKATFWRLRLGRALYSKSSLNKSSLNKSSLNKSSLNVSSPKARL